MNEGPYDAMPLSCQTLGKCSSVKQDIRLTHRDLIPDLHTKNSRSLTCFNFFCDTHELFITMVTNFNNVFLVHLLFLKQSPQIAQSGFNPPASISQVLRLQV
jgi:hypothetical protein